MSDPQSSGGFEAALNGPAEPASPPGSPSVSGESTPAAAVAPSPEGSPDPSSPPEDRSPYIPRERFDTVNTRMQQAEAALQELAWAKAIDRNSLTELVQYAQRLHQEPLTHLEELVRDLSSHPTHGPALRSWFAKQLGGYRQPAADTAPEPDLQTESGQLVYSAPQLQKWHEWNNRQQEAKLQDTLAPLQQTHQQLQQERTWTQLRQQAQADVGAFMQDLGSRPLFAELKGEIATFVQAHPDLDPILAAERGYALALSKRHATDTATAKQDGAKATLADLQSRAVSTALNPAQHAGSRPARHSSFEDYFKANPRK